MAEARPGRDATLVETLKAQSAAPFEFITILETFRLERVKAYSGLIFIHKVYHSKPKHQTTWHNRLYRNYSIYYYWSNSVLHQF